VERHPGAAEVRVRAVLEGATRLVLEVRCNRGEVSPQASDGVGLSNLRQRLAASHGAAATLSLEPVAGGGSLARLVWPC
jgi:signal transduction histidine kinase